MRVGHGPSKSIVELACSAPLFAEAPDACVLSDREGVVLGVNLIAIETFGRRIDRLVGKPFTSFLAGEDMQVAAAMIEVARGGGRDERMLHIRVGASERATRPSIVVVTAIANRSTLFWRLREPFDAGRKTGVPGASEATPTELRVLLVTHDLEANAVMEQVARGLGASTAVASSVEEAIASFSLILPQIVVADMFVRTDDGVDVLSDIRRRALRPLPCGIALSGVSGADSQEALQAGYDSFIRKPVSTMSAKSAFYATLRILKKRAAAAARRRGQRGGA